MSVPPEDPSEELRRQRLVRELSRNVGKFLLDAARAHPGIWEERTPAQAAAEAGWRAVIDAQRDDLALLRQRWPDRESEVSRAAIERLERRKAEGGDAEQAMDAVRAAYGGWDRVPDHVSDRLVAYAEEQL